MTSASGVGLRCRNLGKRYGGTHALKSVDLSLPPGSVLGLVGENGAGKYDPELDYRRRSQAR